MHRSHLPAGPVDVVELHRSTLCGTQGSAPQITLLKDAAALQAWQALHKVDFFNGRIQSIVGGPFAVVELGQRDTGGYSLAVSRRADLREGVLKLTATFLMPQPGEMTAQMITSPCVLVQLPPVEMHDLLLLDPSGEPRAHWRPELATAPDAAAVPSAAPP